MLDLQVSNFHELSSNLELFHAHRFFIGDSKTLNRDYTLIETHKLETLLSLKLETYMPEGLPKLRTLLPNLKELELESQSHSCSQVVHFSHPSLQSFILKAHPKIEFNIQFT